MKIEFSFQRREMVLFLTTNMAAVTYRANQQYVSSFLFLCYASFFHVPVGHKKDEGCSRRRTPQGMA